MSSSYNIKMDKDKFLKELGLNLKIERIRKNLTQEQLAELADCTAPYVGYIERGIKCPTIYQYVKIAGILNIDTGNFLYKLTDISSENVINE